VLQTFSHALQLFSAAAAAEGTSAADIATVAATNRHGQQKDPARGRRRTKDEQRQPTGSLAYGIQYAGVELDYNLRVIAQW